MRRALLLLLIPVCANAQTPTDLRAVAHEYYEWRDSVNPVGSSDQGKHLWDDRIADYRMAAVHQRRARINALLTRLQAWPTKGWAKDDVIDKVLFTSQIERDAFFARVLRPEESDPQVFHDQFISYGSLPVSVVEWLMLDDDTSLRRALSP